MSIASHGEAIIGNYRVTKTIGEGTFGKVRLGVHIPTGQKVAVKTLQKQKIAEQADIERVTRQICILKVLRHPNIVQLYQIIETKTDIHLIMEYASGGELFDYIVKKKRLDQQEAVGFMQQILAGVEYIHKNGVVHRDLKPQNLLFDEHRRIKIVDFGLSNQYKVGQKLKTACGSPCYAAPQMIAGKRYECSNIDIWSCGIILYAMLCGYLPFQDANTNKLYKKIMAGDYEEPKMLTPTSKQILKNILNVNPETRFKINQIKETRWYNLTGKKYEAPGILVGTDPISPDERVVATMKKMGCSAQVSQINNYITNNRHNHVTAFYYLLKKKAQNFPSILVAEPRNDKQSRRSNSPLIYKPDNKKDFYIPGKKPATENKDTTKVNDSFNASTIVSSLVEANKSKLISNLNKDKINKKIQNFDKIEDNKNFPKHKNSSQYEPQSPMTPLQMPVHPNPVQKTQSLTSRNDIEEKKTLQFSSKGPQKQQPAIKPESLAQIVQRAPESPLPQKPNITISESKMSPNNKNHQRKTQQSFKNEQNFSTKNKRREELSDQLKQISMKIDKQIVELRKHNNMNASMMSQKRRDSLTNNIPGMQVPTLKFKNNGKVGQKSERTENAVLLSDNLNKQFRNGIRAHTQRMDSQPLQGIKTLTSKQTQPANKFPKMHFGPFNAQCLLMQAPRAIILRVIEHLTAMKVAFKEIDLFTLRLQNNEIISVQSIHGISGYYVVKFSHQNALADNLIDFLAQQRV